MRFTTVDLLRIDGGKVTKESVHELEGSALAFRVKSSHFSQP